MGSFLSTHTPPVHPDSTTEVPPSESTVLPHATVHEAQGGMPATDLGVRPSFERAVQQIHDRGGNGGGGPGAATLQQIPNATVILLNDTQLSDDGTQAEDAVTGDEVIDDGGAHTLGVIGDDDALKDTQLMVDGRKDEDVIDPPQPMQHPNALPPSHEPYNGNTMSEVMNASIDMRQAAEIAGIMGTLHGEREEEQGVLDVANGEASFNISFLLLDTTGRIPAAIVTTLIELEDDSDMRINPPGHHRGEMGETSEGEESQCERLAAGASDADDDDLTPLGLKLKTLAKRQKATFKGAACVLGELPLAIAAVLNTVSTDSTASSCPSVTPTPDRQQRMAAGSGIVGAAAHPHDLRRFLLGTNVRSTIFEEAGRGNGDVFKEASPAAVAACHNAMTTFVNHVLLRAGGDPLKCEDAHCLMTSIISKVKSVDVKRKLRPSAIRLRPSGDGYILEMCFSSEAAALLAADIEVDGVAYIEPINDIFPPTIDDSSKKVVIRGWAPAMTDAMLVELMAVAGLGPYSKIKEGVVTILQRSNASARALAFFFHGFHNFGMRTEVELE